MKRQELQNKRTSVYRSRLCLPSLICTPHQQRDLRRRPPCSRRRWARQRQRQRRRWKRRRLQCLVGRWAAAAGRGGAFNRGRQNAAPWSTDRKVFYYQFLSKNSKDTLRERKSKKIARSSKNIGPLPLPPLLTSFIMVLEATDYGVRTNSFASQVDEIYSRNLTKAMQPPVLL